MTRQPLHPLTARQVDLLKQTFKKINQERFAMRFYSNLFVHHPEIKSLFPNDLNDLSTKIVSVIHLVTHSFKETSQGEYNLQPELVRPLQSLGQLHSSKGVVHEHYPWANETLIKSIREEYPADFTQEYEQAWKYALDQVTAAMIGEPLPGSNQHKSIRDSFTYIKSLLFRKDSE